MRVLDFVGLSINPLLQEPTIARPRGALASDNTVSRCGRILSRPGDRHLFSSVGKAWLTFSNHAGRRDAGGDAPGAPALAA